MPRQPLTSAWGVIPLVLRLLGIERVGDAATGTQVALESDPGASATVLGRFDDAPSRTVVAMECAYSAT